MLDFNRFAAFSLESKSIKSNNNVAGKGRQKKGGRGWQREGYKGSVSAAIKIKSADHTMYDDFLEIKVATFDSFDEALRPRREGMEGGTSPGWAAGPALVNPLT